MPILHRCSAHYNIRILLHFFFNGDILPTIKYAFLLYRGATLIGKNSLHKEELNKYFISCLKTG